MEIDLLGQTALVVAGNGSFVGPLEAALAASGASVSVREPAAGEPQMVVAELMTIAGRLDVLVVVSPTLGDQNENDPVAIFEASVGRLDSYTHAASHALAEASGRIVVIGSALGLLPSLRNPLGGLADAALFQLVRETAMWLGPRGVRINALALGAIGGGGAGDTPSTAGDDGFLSHTAFKRPGTIADVTNAMLFLADPQNTYMTGHILTVDGGWTTGFARDF